MILLLGGIAIIVILGYIAKVFYDESKKSEKTEIYRPTNKKHFSESQEDNLVNCLKSETEIEIKNITREDNTSGVYSSILYMPEHADNQPIRFTGVST